MPYQRNGKWYADLRYTDSQGRRKRCRKALGSTVKSLRAAKRAESEIAAELESERHRLAMGGTPARPKVYLSGLLDLYLQQPGRKASTIRAYEVHIRKHLLPLLGDVPISQIHRRHIDAAMVSLMRSGLAPGSVTNILAPLAGALTLAVRWDYLAASPMRGFVWPRKNNGQGQRQDFVWFDTEQTAAFLNVGASHTPQLWPMWLMLFRAGLRCGEGMALRWDDLDLIKGEVHVRRTADKAGNLTSPKGNRPRRVPLPPQTVQQLRACRHLNGDLFCPRPNGGMWDHDRLARRWHLVRRAATLPDCTLHTTRHSYASQLVSRGVPLLAVQRLLGHSTAQETQRYAHLSPKQTRQWVGLLEEPVGTQSGHKVNK